MTGKEHELEGNSSEPVLLTDDEARAEMLKISQLAQKLTRTTLYVLEALPDEVKNPHTSIENSIHYRKAPGFFMEKIWNLESDKSEWLHINIRQTTRFGEVEEGGWRERYTLFAYESDHFTGFPYVTSSTTATNYPAKWIQLDQPQEDYHINEQGEISLIPYYRDTPIRTLFNDPQEIRFIGGTLYGMLGEVENIRREHGIPPLEDPKEENHQES